VRPLLPQHIGTVNGRVIMRAIGQIVEILSAYLPFYVSGYKLCVMRYKNVSRDRKSRWVEGRGAPVLSRGMSPARLHALVAQGLDIDALFLEAPSAL
jgi:hypothetical protein